jgi:hypothetical protein
MLIDKTNPKGLLTTLPFFGLYQLKAHTAVL